MAIDLIWLNRYRCLKGLQGEKNNAIVAIIFPPCNPWDSDICSAKMKSMAIDMILHHSIWPSKPVHSKHISQRPVILHTIFMQHQPTIKKIVHIRSCFVLHYVIIHYYIAYEHFTRFPANFKILATCVFRELTSTYFSQFSFRFQVRAAVRD